MCRRRRVRPSAARAALLGLAGMLGACGPEVRNPGESHRHLAEEWCRENVDHQEKCKGHDYSEETKAEKRARCEAGPRWDWTDECGDYFWEYSRCVLDTTCEEYARIGGPREHDPCQVEEEATYSNECRVYEMGSGPPIDHGQGD